MNKGEEFEHFQLLEEKIDSLINRVTSLKNEKEALMEKAQIHDEKISDLVREVEELKSTRDHARQRVISLLEKMEQIEV